MSKPIYELRIDGVSVAFSKNLKNLCELVPRSSPLSSKEGEEFYEFRAPCGGWVEIKKKNKTTRKIK